MNLIKGGSAKSKIFMVFIIIIIITVFLTQLGLVYLKFKREEVLKNGIHINVVPLFYPMLDRLNQVSIQGHYNKNAFQNSLYHHLMAKFFHKCPFSV